MNKSEFFNQIWLTLLDKGLLALILAGAAFWLNRVLEAFKSKLSMQQETARGVKTAVLDLTRKLAAGSHVISWPTWTPENITWLDETKFATYQTEMAAIVNDLVGLQASLAALDHSKHGMLRPFAE